MDSAVAADQLVRSNAGGADVKQGSTMYGLCSGHGFDVALWRCSPSALFMPGGWGVGGW
jgi:hypothetical protein